MVQSLLARRPDLLPSFAIVLGGVLWGLFWIPIRMLGGYGLEGPWPGLVTYGACGLLLLPFLPKYWGQLKQDWQSLAITGLFTGTAFALYATSLLLTDVVRVLLLFYLSPAWSTMLGLAFLGERITRYRILALLFGFAGLLVVLGAGVRFPWPSNLGDWLALASGASWAYGSLRLYKSGSVSTFEQLVVFILGGFAVLAVGAAFGSQVFGPGPDLGTLAGAGPLALVVGLFMLPMLFLTIWPATRLSPGRVGILLMSEVVVGVVSAALFAGEVFGVREVIGTLLILAAGAVEVLGRQTTAPRETV